MDAVPNNEPTLVPLSEVDPKAARDARRRLRRELTGVKALTGLGEDPAGVAAAPAPTP
jgi:hypothetical protein